MISCATSLGMYCSNHLFKDFGVQSEKVPVIMITKCFICDYQMYSTLILVDSFITISDAVRLNC